MNEMNEMHETFSDTFLEFIELIEKGYVILFYQSNDEKGIYVEASKGGKALRHLVYKASYVRTSPFLSTAKKLIKCLEKPNKENS